MDSGVLMAESFDDEQDVARLPAKHLGEFKEKVERLDLDEEQRAIVSYFYQLAESTNIFEKDQREIERLLVCNSTESLAISSLVKKGVVTKGKRGKFNYYMFNLALELPTRKTGVVIPFRKIVR